MNLPIELDTFPTINAALNSSATVLLLAGFWAARRRRFRAHAGCMIGALAISALFLASYVTYHFLKQRVTGSAHTSFTATGPIRPVYFTILITHLVLAIAIVPMVARTVYLAARQRFTAHRRIARWTLPFWAYVSVTGVVVYVMLYHLYPPMT